MMGVMNIVRAYLAFLRIVQAQKDIASETELLTYAEWDSDTLALIVKGYVRGRLTADEALGKVQELIQEGPSI